MRTIPYDYKPDRVYLGRLASVGERVLPSADGDIRLVKAVLATPYWLDGDTRRHSSELEAAVWWVAGSGGDTDELLTAAGVDLRADPVRPPKRPVWLRLKFTGRLTGRYQSLAKWLPEAPGRYPVEDLVVDELLETKLVIRNDGLVSRPGFRDVQLTGRILPQLLRALDDDSPRYVSLGTLKSAVKKWTVDTEEQTVVATVSQLRSLVPNLGLKITDRNGEDGWALITTEPANDGVPPESDQTRPV